MAQIGSSLSTLLARLSWAVRAGLQFGGKRNLYAVFGWKQRLIFRDFVIKYARQGVATRIINQPVTSTWSPPPRMLGDKDLVDAWLAFLKLHPEMWGVIKRADRLAGLGRYATIFVGYNDVTKQADLVKPVRTNGDLKVLYFQPYGEEASAVMQFEDNPAHPRFGLPAFYDLRLLNPELATRTDYIPTQPMGSVVRGISQKVHWSRVIHIADGVLEDETFGVPRLMPVYNDLDDLMKVGGGAAEMFWLNARSGMQVDVDKDMELDENDAAALQDELEEYQHELRRTIRTRGVKINTLKNDVQSPKDTVETILELISAHTGIPKSVLTGMPIGHLASTQDRANYATLIEDRRTEFAEPNVLAPIIRALQYTKILPTGSFHWGWESAFRLSPLEEGQTRAQMARSAANLQKVLSGQGAGRGGTPGARPFITQQEARIILGFPAEESTNPEKPAGI